jgi:glycosyltransferase involved in cell wall biosynthesis
MPRAAPTASACVVAAIDGAPHQDLCLRSLAAHTPRDVRVVSVARSAKAVNRAIGERPPMDVVVLLDACRVGAGWLERLHVAATAETNTATASALGDAGTPLAVCDADGGADIAQLAESVAKHSLKLRPRLLRAVGPCIYVRREAIRLIGPLDERLELRPALEVDFAQRCILSGLAHVAADDVAVERLAPVSGTAQLPRLLQERYPYLSQTAEPAASAVLPGALAAARGPRARLSVTIDARVLGGVLTGTHVHVLELIRALAHTEALQLRLLVARGHTEVRDVLRSLPDTETLAAEELGPDTPRSTIFHRPQQTFSSEDVRIALSLGERFVLSQLDLIGYRNPGYFPDPDTWCAAQRATRQGLAAADRVVVFSEHTRHELIADALADDERIRVVPPGLDHGPSGEPRPPRKLERWRARSSANGGSPGFLLCLGTDFRHKNRPFALQLLAALRERHGWQGNLVLAGAHVPDGSSRQLERELIERDPSLESAVIELGPVDEQEKAWLMEHAAAVVYPSTYEGFGLVPFESALSGVPCAFAAQSSLAEIAPEGTATIVPWDPDESAAAVHSLLADAKARSRHVRALAAAARRLTWAKSAKALVAVYREAALAPARESATVSRDSLRRERELIDAHDALVARLVGEREHAKGMYDALNAEVGFGLSLIGPHGALPDDVQRALLALSARPGLSRLVYRPAAGAFAATRSIARTLRRLRRAR